MKNQTKRCEKHGHGLKHRCLIECWTVCRHRRHIGGGSSAPQTDTSQWRECYKTPSTKCHKLMSHLHIHTCTGRTPAEVPDWSDQGPYSHKAKSSSQGANVGATPKNNGRVSHNFRTPNF